MKLSRLVLLLTSAAVAVTSQAAQRQVRALASLVGAPVSSNPTSFTRVGSLAYFTASDGVNGQQLWKTDGTAAGTTYAADGDWRIRNFGGVGNGVVFLTQEDGINPNEVLWFTDGTPNGTVRLQTIRAPAEYGTSFAIAFAAADDKAFIAVRERYSDPATLWVTDGTVSGTTRVGVFPMTMDVLTGLNGKLYFNGADTSVGTQLWVSDGTVEGTHIVPRNVECYGSQQCATPAPRALARFGDRLFITTEQAVWVSDGTAGGTIKLAEVSWPEILAVNGENAYFRTSSSGLWRTDGTVAGTRQITSSAVWWGDFRENGHLAFVVYEPRALWETDGTSAGTHQIAAIPFSSAVGLVGDAFLFTGGENEGELWSANFDTGTAALLKDIDPRFGSEPYASNPGPGIRLGGRVVFAATSGAGREVWSSDGTTAGTILTANIAAEPAGGAVSGTVRDATTNAAVAGVRVFVCAAQCTDSSFVNTNASGEYRIEGIIPGTYQMLVARGTTHLASATVDVTVTGGFEVLGVDFTVARGGSIQGAVKRAATNEPVRNLRLAVRDASRSVVQQISTSVTGNYATSALPAGSYTIETAAQLSALQRPVVDQIYRDHNCPNAPCDPTTGDVVEVTAGVPTANIDFSLHEYGVITGTLRRANSNLPVAGALVYFYRGGPGTAPSFWTWNASTTSNADGTYTSPLLAPGSYYVRAAAFNRSVIYPSVACSVNDCPVESGTTVAVTMDGTTPNADFSLTHDDAQILGVLTDSTGTPLGGVNVTLHDSNGNYVSAYGLSTTSSSGQFLLSGMPSGTYYIKALDEIYENGDCATNPCPLTNATPITLTAGNAQSINWQLRSRRVTITGRVLNAVTGNPVNTGGVTLYGASGRAWTSASMNGGTYTVTATTRETAYYIVGGAEAYHSVLYESVVDPVMTCNSSPSPCPIPPGGTALTPADHTGIDLRISPRGKINGRVTDAATGLPLSMQITIYTSAGQVAGNTFTAGDGTYTWPYAAGTYYVAATPYSHSQYFGQVFPDRDCSAECVATAGDLVNAPDGAITVVDFHLTKKPQFRGRISGRVTDAATGAGIADVYVATTSLGANARTDANGNYTLEGEALVDGSYRLVAEAGRGYFYSVYGGVNCADFYNCDRSSGTVVQVTGPDTTTVNFQLIRLRVTSVSPSVGPAAGGTTVTINGTNFVPEATVKFGATAATIVSLTPTQIVVTAPPGTPGPAHVTVSNSPQYLNVTLSHGFTYYAPLAIDARSTAAAVTIRGNVPPDATSTTLYRRLLGASSWTELSTSGGAQTEFMDATATRGVVYEYRVDAVTGAGALSATDVTMLFTDDPLVARATPIKRAHFDELRALINAHRARRGLSPFDFDATYSSSAVIRASHLAALRTAIAEWRAASGLGAVPFTDSGASASMIKAIHIQELRELTR